MRPLSVLALLVGLGVSLGPVHGAGATVTKAIVFGTNVIPNAGGEASPGATDNSAVSVPRWHPANHFTVDAYAANRDLSASSPGPSSRGKNYFYGGPDNASSSGWMRIFLTSKASEIKTGRVAFKLSAWLGGFSTQDDFTRVLLAFSDKGRVVLKSYQLKGPSAAQRKDVSELQYRKVTGPVPASADSARVEILMKRTEGSDDDGLADNVKLVLSEAR